MNNMLARFFRDDNNGSAPNSPTDEASWMDYSIRMHLQNTKNNNDTNKNSNNCPDDYEERDEEYSAYLAVEVPHDIAAADSVETYHHHEPVVPVAPLADAEVLEDVNNVTTCTGPTTFNHYNTPEIFDISQLRKNRSHDTDTTNTSSLYSRSTSPSPNNNNNDVVHGRKNKTLQQYFGLRKNNCRTSSVSRFIVPRTSLPYTIEHNSITSEWMAIINTDQERVISGSFSDSTDDNVDDNIIILKFETLHEAREACHAFAPPRMHSFQDNSNCHICKKKFHKVLRRPCHCKNCGVCVCPSCSTIWPLSMVPPTYLKKTWKTVVKVCVACDWLSETFRSSLIDGDVDKAVTLFHTGNVNLRCPFAKGKNETYYPVHCAVLGGQLGLLKWLIETHCCPINHTDMYSKSDSKQSRIGKEAVITSKGRSVLSLAMESHQLEIQRYLIVERKMNYYHFTNLRLALKNLALCLTKLPEGCN